MKSRCDTEGDLRPFSLNGPLGVGPREVLGFRRKELSNEALLALRMMFLAFKTLF
jgi:hypothetical protein